VDWIYSVCFYLHAMSSNSSASKAIVQGRSWPCDVFAGERRGEFELVAKTYGVDTIWVQQRCTIAESHPSIAFAKELIEHLVDEAEHSYADVGGNWYRNGVVRGNRVWNICPILDEVDQAREDKRQRLKANLEKSRNVIEGKVSYKFPRCKCRAEACTHVKKYRVALMNHSCYNMSREEFLAICQKFERVYVYPPGVDCGVLAGGEMEFRLDDGVMTSLARKNAHTYVHPWPLPFQDILDKNECDLWHDEYDTKVYCVTRFSAVQSTLPSRSTTPLEVHFDEGSGFNAVAQ